MLGEKIAQLRKQRGWSQEDLASHLDVSRQSVSKWESNQSLPDIERIKKLSSLFQITIDELLNEEDHSLSYEQNKPSCKEVSYEEATNYIQVLEEVSKKFAFATTLCVLSPIALIFLASYSEYYSSITENQAVGMGVITLILLVATAVSLFIQSGARLKNYHYFEDEFIINYRTRDLISESKESYSSYFTKIMTIGVVLCILSVIPLFIAIMIDEDNDMLIITSVCLLLAIVSLAVNLFVRSGMVMSGYQKILQLEDYAPSEKRFRKQSKGFNSAYWLIITGVYLLLSFNTNSWSHSWIIWSIAGVLYPVYLMIVRRYHSK